MSDKYPKKYNYHKIPGETSITIWKVSEELKRKFKAVCAAKNVTMRRVLLNCIQDFVNRATANPRR